MFYYYATTHEKTINFEREATAEEFNLLDPHISKISKMLVDKRRINIRKQENTLILSGKQLLQIEDMGTVART